MGFLVGSCIRLIIRAVQYMGLNFLKFATTQFGDLGSDGCFQLYALLVGQFDDR